MLYCKHPNRSTLHPCPYCLVDQPYHDPEGGSLGHSTYDIDKYARTRGQILEARRELASMATGKAQSDRSMDLGVVEPDEAHPVWPLYDLVKVDPLKACPVESLHADALVSLYIRKISLTFWFLDYRLLYCTANTLYFRYRTAPKMDLFFLFVFFVSFVRRPV